MRRIRLPTLSDTLFRDINSLTSSTLLHLHEHVCQFDTRFYLI